MFFDFRRNKFINIFLIIQIAIWFFCMSSLVSILRFEESYTSRYERSFSLSTSATIKFEKMMVNNFEEVDKYVDILNLLDKENIEYGLSRQYIQMEDELDPEELRISKKHFKKNFREGEFYNEKIQPIVINYTLVKKYKNSIDGEINKEQWKTVDNRTPIILGKDFKKEYKIGNTFNYQNRIFEIVGFFNESILIPTKTDQTTSSMLTDSNMILPIENDYDLNKYSFEPIIVYFNNNLDDNLQGLNDKLKDITENFTIEKPSKDLERMLEYLKDEKLFELIRVLIISLIATASISITIIYLIVINKKRIGILYSVGCSKMATSKIMFKEFFVFVITGILIGSILYVKNGLNVFAFFLNENLMANEIISMTIIILLIGLVFSLNITVINKITPRELIGGFRE